ncbi:MAG: alpha/beta hydrolase [Acidobacteria bacterium]|nr:MAG: alpha/beta hydrolase [Acidobacteriota bacterium]
MLSHLMGRQARGNIPSRWRTFAKYLVLAVAVTAVVLEINYATHDKERLSLNEDVRNSLLGGFVRLPDGITHYELGGPADAPTVVLIHGFSIPEYLWDPTFGYLVSARFRVLRYDLFGRGYSDRPNLNYDGNLFDRQLIDLLSALKISDRVHIVGCSMGGSITVTFAARHPGRIRSVTLIGPGYLSGGRLPFRLREPIIGEYTMGVSVAPSLPESQREDLYHPERFPEYVEKYRPQMQYKGFRSALLSTLRHYIVADSSGDYRRLGQTGLPVLLIWGKFDRDVPLAISEKRL